MNRSIPTRCSIVGLAGIALTLPWVASGAWHAVHSGMNDATDWVGDRFPSLREYEQFCVDFESGDAAIISWPGCTIDNPRLDLLADAIRRADALRRPDGSPAIDRLVTGRQVFLQLVSPPLDLPRAEAVERLSGTLVGPDGVTTCVVASLSDAGRDARPQVLSSLIDIVARECRIDTGELHIAGPALEAYYLDQSTRETILRYGGWSALMTLVAAVLLLRSLRLGLFVFGTAFYCQLATLALIRACGDELNAFLTILPSLILVLGVSGGVHLVNYYVEGAGAGPVETGAARALAQGWLPCALSAGTTAIGLASLLVSRIVPIREFGGYGAVGMLITLAMLLLIVPGACQWSAVLGQHRAIRRRDSRRNGKRRSARSGFPRFPLRWPKAVLGTSIVAMFVAGCGLPYLRTSVRVDSLFGHRSPLMLDYAWLDGNVGPLVPVEVVVRFDAGSSLPLMTRVQMVRDVERALAAIPQVGGTLSAATFLPPPDDGGGIRSVVRRRLAQRRIERQMPRLVELGYVNHTDHAESWRVTARVSIFNARPYDRLFDEIHLGAAAGISHSGVQVLITGITPFAHQIQRDLMRDLVASFLCALALITAVMMISQRSFILGLAAMVPNIFPVVILFGTLGWLDVPVDIGSVMIASLALGMAIDGTQHFVTFFRDGLSQGQSVERSVTAAYRHCSKAILVSALICGVGLAVFTFSPFATVSRCALIICAAVIAMTAGDLILLPAILMLTGRRFLARRSGRPG